MEKIIKKKKGFTLIELIVTIAVLGILVLLASPRFFGHTQNAQLTKGFANARTIQKASEQYYMDHEDWPRLTDEPYTSEEIESYSERIFDNTGQEVNLDPEGNYYDIDYDKLSDYVKVSDDKKNYILQNPVGKVFYMDNLNETGVARVDYSSTKEENDNPIPVNEPINFAYTGQPQNIELGKGTYKLEVWGAKGGYNTGGKGGYSSGILSIPEHNTLHVYVGQKGKSGTTTRDKSFNGGGYGYTSDNGIRSHGGGASDIRLIGGSWNDTRGLYSRIIVAGGGGGGYLYSGKTYFGGAGGGTNGISPTTSKSYGKGGTQTSGGVSLFSLADSLMNGTFGVGGDGNPRGETYTLNGGGGGWYGGGGGNAAGGGSGYALTESSHKPSGYNVSEEFYLEDTQLIAGDKSMPNPNGGTMVGNSGHGFARITRVD